MAKIFKHRTDVPYFDYKDFKTLQRYVNVYGQIETRKKTGLTESQQHDLFSLFKRFHTHVEGTGVGLYVVRRTLENAGGRIGVTPQRSLVKCAAGAPRPRKCSASQS